MYDKEIYVTTTKWIIAIITTAITSSYATSHFNQYNQIESSATLNKKFSSNPSSSPSVAIVQHSNFISAEKTFTRDNCEKQFGQVKVAQTNTDKINSNPAAPNLEEMQFAYEKKQAEIAAFREFTERAGDNVVSVISNNYNAEPIDPEWARSKEDELLTLLNNNETLRNTTPLELSCKSQNCRLILSAQDENQGESLYSAFKSDALQGSDENKKQVISYFSNPDSNEIHIYLSKSTFNELLEERKY